MVQVIINGATKNVCWQSLNYYASKYMVCRHLGYRRSAHSFVNVSRPTDAKDETFSGDINCNYGKKYLSQCSITASANESCSQLSFINCKCGKKINNRATKLLLNKKLIVNTRVSRVFVALHSMWRIFLKG